MEEFRDIIDYKGLYKISDQGRVKSLKRKVKWNGTTRMVRERVLKTSSDGDGYLSVGLHNGKPRRHKIATLVAIAFLNHRPDGTTRIVVDHVNNIKTDNKLVNLQLISHRENGSKDRWRGNYSSQYVGVNFNKRTEKWVAQIRMNGKQKHLGLFTYEIDAHYAYQDALSKL